jgi:hypothetical protein
MCVGVQVGLDAIGHVVRRERREGEVLDGLAGAGGALDSNVPFANSTSSSLASSMCAAIRLALSITRSAAFDTAMAPTAADREP